MKKKEEIFKHADTVPSTAYELGRYDAFSQIYMWLLPKTRVSGSDYIRLGEIITYLNKQIEAYSK